MARSARRAALELLGEVLHNGAYMNLAAKNALADLDGRDRAFATALCALTLENLDSIDELLEPFIKSKKVNAKIRDILRLSACQMTFMGVSNAAAVNEGVSLARECGKGALTGFVNGVLRAYSRQARRMEPSPSLPGWLEQRLDAELGEGAARRLSEKVLPTVRVLDDGVIKSLGSRGVTLLKSPLLEGFYSARGLSDIGRDPDFLEGRYTVMSLSSGIAVSAVYDAQPAVLDACAAPGGKSAYLYQLSGRKAAITAWDVHAHRVALMDATFNRLGVLARTQVKDAAVHDAKYDNSFGLVMVDAPCSGLGMLGRKPDIARNKSPEDIAALSRLQADILRCCAQYVAVGGTLAYFTCTVLKEENGDVVDGFLNSDGRFQPKALKLPKGLGIDGSGGRVQLLPGTCALDGFFIAAMERTR